MSLYFSYRSFWLDDLPLRSSPVLLVCHYWYVTLGVKFQEEDDLRSWHNAVGLYLRCFWRKTLDYVIIPTSHIAQDNILVDCFRFVLLCVCCCFLNLGHGWGAMNSLVVVIICLHAAFAFCFQI